MKKAIYVLGVLLISSLVGLFFCAKESNMSKTADIILYNGKVITVDGAFSIKEAVAVSGDKILAVGNSADVEKMAGSATERIDLMGKTVIPGLMDAHLHPDMAAYSELDEEIPDVNTIKGLLKWVKQQAEKKKDGEWIVHPKFFATRFIEMRQPTLKELDKVAPKNPIFLNGSYGGMINTAALRKSGITRETDSDDIMKDPKSGEPIRFVGENRGNDKRGRVSDSPLQRLFI